MVKGNNQRYKEYFKERGQPMTLQHYIGSNKELPLGTIGQNPTYKPFSELNISMFDKKQKSPKSIKRRSFDRSI
ncbi:hypothetical protein OE903_15135 [Bacillus sp. B6(2022)]|nr:hypothetical protein [Bacillus sp. B6(2022)]